MFLGKYLFFFLWKMVEIIYKSNIVIKKCNILLVGIIGRYIENFIEIFKKWIFKIVCFIDSVLCIWLKVWRVLIFLVNGIC